VCNATYNRAGMSTALSARTNTGMDASFMPATLILRHGNSTRHRTCDDARNTRGRTTADSPATLQHVHVVLVGHLTRLLACTAQRQQCIVSEVATFRGLKRGCCKGEQTSQANGIEIGTTDSYD
jgi:hypothetical protein